VTLGIATYLRNEVLIETIRQALRLQPPPDEIIVVDQTPIHDTKTDDFLNACHKQGVIQYIKHDSPSLPKARNRILAESKNNIVIFIDDDVELPESYIASHAANYVDEDIVLVAGPSLTKAQLDAHLQSVEQEVMRRPADSWQDVRGCNHSVRRQSAIEAGGYDENFIASAGGEEGDFSERLREKSGGKQVYDPNAWLIHLRSPSGGCRIPKNPSWSEWQKTVGPWLYIFRHHKKHQFNFLYWIFRYGPGRRENILQPWRQPGAWMSFVYAAFVARRMVKKVSSPFNWKVT